MNKLRKFNKIKEWARSFSPNFTLNLIRRFLPKDCESILDVGCGKNSVVQYLPKGILKVGVDIYKPDLDISRAKGIHSQYFLDDVNNIDKIFKNNSFDAVIAIGLLEHLTKSDALSLISKMEQIAKKSVLIETPSGFVRQGGVDGNYFQNHLSGFSSDDLGDLGYKVFGKDAFKSFRIDKHGDAREMNIFTAVFVTLAEPLFRHFPKYCLNIFAYKDLRESKLHHKK